VDFGIKIIVQTCHLVPTSVSQYLTARLFLRTCGLLCLLFFVYERSEASGGQPSGASSASASDATISTKTQPASGESARLQFRAILRDENGNLLLHTGERLSVEIEVKNEGPAAA